MSWPNDFDRGAVIGWIEEALGNALNANDAQADTLIATAQGLGLLPSELKIWIYDNVSLGRWTAENLTAWARRYHGAAAEVPARCSHCGGEISEGHAC